MPDEERYDRTIALIDGALERGDTSPDAMRWRPESREESTSSFRGGRTHQSCLQPGRLSALLHNPERERQWHELEVAIMRMLDVDPTTVEAGSVCVNWSVADAGPTGAWVEWRVVERTPNGTVLTPQARGLNDTDIARLADLTRTLSTRGQDHHE